MNKLNLSNLEHERMGIKIADSQGGLLITVIGDIDIQDPSKVLDPFFEKLHKGAVEHEVKSIDIDFRGLNFLNSSGIKALAKWAVQLTLLKPEKRYTIRILINKTSTWQSTSLPTLAMLVPGSISVA